jgi:hypothetical protein
MLMRPHPIAVALALFVVAASRASAQSDSVADTSHRSSVVTHTVKRGDTLWDIAKYYLQDPFSWPTVFHANTGVVKNPHWIYPGQILSIPRATVRDAVAARTDRHGNVATSGQTRGTRQPTVFLAQAPMPIARQNLNLAPPPPFTVRPGEHEAAPFVSDTKQPLDAGEIVGAVDRPALGLTSDAGFTVYDRLYVTPPAGLLLKKGDKLLLAKRSDIILDIGQVIEPTGILRVDSVPASGPILGTIVNQYQAIKDDHITLPYKQTFKATTVHPVHGTYATEGKVLWIRRRPPLPSIQTYVIIGIPSSEQVQLGDQFTLYNQSKSDIEAHVPPVAMATVQIVRVTPQGATGLIVNQKQPQIEEEMPARLTAKMP